MKQNLQIKFFLFLALAMVGTCNVWGWCGAKVYVISEPSTGGYVYANTSNSGSATSLTKDEASNQNKTALSKKTFDFYLFASAKSGYTFKGWSTNQSATSGTVSSPYKVSLTGNVGVSYTEYTYYAIFKANTYTIAFNGNGSTSGSTASQTHTYDASKNLTANGFTKAYTVSFDTDGGSSTSALTSTASFAGWATTSGGSVAYSNQQSVTNLSSTQGATVNLYAKWNTQQSITLPNCTKTNCVLEGWYNGSTKVGVAGESYTPSANITLKAKWIAKYPFTMSCNVNALKVDETKGSAFTFTYASNPTPHIADGSIISYNASTNTITGLKDGSTTIYFTQAETSTIVAGTSATYTITVSKIANTLTADATHSMKVDEQWNGVVSTNSDATITTSSNNETVAYYDIANNRILAPNSNNQSFVSKEVTITISQAATYKYTAASKTIKVTVNKHVPTFTWSTAPVYHNQTINDYFTTTGTNALTVKSSTDADVAYLVEGTGKNLNLKTLSKNASTTLTVTQAENYYWAAKTATTTITPTNVPNHVPFTLTESMYNALKGATSGAQAWDGGIRVGDPSGGGFNYNDKYCVIGPFAGIPDKFSCSYSCSNAATDRDWRVYESADGSSWNQIVSSSSAGSASNIQLASTTRYLKFLWSGNFAGYFSNITVTELKTFATDKSALDFGENRKDIPCAAQTFTFNYANVGHKVNLACNDNHFTVSPNYFTNLGGEQCGSKTITVTYNTAEVHTASGAKITISDELGNSQVVALAGFTTKKEQTLTWATEYQSDQPTIPVGKTITNAASASTGKAVTYSTSDASIIEIVNDGAAFRAVAAGSATITAHQAGDEDWKAVESTKTFVTTYKTIQNIHWNQSFRKLKYEEGKPKETMGLTASVYLVNSSTGEETYSAERTDMLQYASGNAAIVSVSGTTLTINGVGETTLTASIEGDEDYEAATTTLPVRVRVPSEGCDDPLLVNYTDEIEFFAMNTSEIVGDEIAIDRANGNPDKLSFWHQGKAWKFALEYYAGSIKAQQKVNGTWSDVAGSEVTPTKNQYNQLANLQLNREATAIRFVRPSGGEGYHYVKDIEVTLLKYIESETTTVDFGTINVSSTETKHITVNYSNIQGDVEMTKSNSAITITGAIDTECGGRGSQDIAITYNPSEVETLDDQLYFRDKVTNVSLTVNLKGKSIRSAQSITWNPSTLNVPTTGSIDLNATTSSGLAVTYEVTNGKDLVTIENGVATIIGAGQVTIVASQKGSPAFNPAEDVTKIFTITQVDPTVTWPTAETITYGQALSASALIGGSAVNDKSETVTGSFAWKNGSAILNAGENEQVVVFTPTNTNWYTSPEQTIHIVVNKAISSATATAETITYGQKVSESVLNNDGTDGTWAWDNAIKDDVKDAGTYNDLAIHFTPANPNYTTLDATVSLTVNKAQPTITWNGESTYAWGKVANLFSADNGATVTMTSLDETIAKIEDNQIVPVKAGTVFIRGAIDETANYLAASLDQSITFNAPAENVFTNAAGDNDWNNPDNWTSGVAPATTEDVNVIINGEMVIDETIIVNSMTIESGASVKVIVNGDLSIHDASLTRDNYGDLFIKNGGAVELSSTSSKKMMVHNFVIESSIGTDGTSTSGQISNADALAFDEGGDAYIDINLDPSGTADDNQWYGFTVPFPVEIATGIARKENDGSFKVLADKTNFDIMKYNPAKRLNTGKGWEYYHGTLQPGEFYYIGFDGSNNVYSFRKKNGSALVSESTMTLAVNGENTNPNANWNAVGNPTLQQVEADYAGQYVQVYVNGESRYQAVKIDEANFVVGCPFFIQASEEGTLTLTADNSHTKFYAPSRQTKAATSDVFRVRFGQDANNYTDQIFVSASEDALNQYEIGHDVMKLGVGTTSAQMWVNAYNQKLCANEAVLTNNNADFALTLYAPKAGEYTVSINREKMPNDAALYLTENGNIIWNLSTSDYTVELNKGNNTNYGLRLVQEHRITTDTENVETKAQTNKMIINSNMYIFREGKIYDATGKLVKY